MKKVDIIVILAVLIISISSYVTYFSRNGLDGEVYIEISYKNMKIFNVKLDNESEMIIEITSKDRVLTVNTSDKTTNFEIKSDDEILNIISIENGVTRMIDANCEDKSICMQMKLTRSLPSPIICINGIIVKLVSSVDEYVIQI